MILALRKCSLLYGILHTKSVTHACVYSYNEMASYQTTIEALFC